MNKKGFIFLCSDVTEAECLKLGLFGGTEKYAARVRGLEKGDKLFLYNYNTKQLIGVFTATTDARTGIAPEAWSKEFQFQVKVKRDEKCKPLSREDIANDEYLQTVIKFDRAGRPSSRLSPETVSRLKTLFNESKRVRTYDDNAQYRADDGHWVRSKAELEIDNWLYKNRVVHAYETMIPGAKRCDFEIPTKNGPVYIEFWGLNHTKYLKDKANKKKIYKDHNLNLIELEQKDLKNLDEILKVLL